MPMPPVIAEACKHQVLRPKHPCTWARRFGSAGHSATSCCRARTHKGACVGPGAGVGASDGTDAGAGPGITPFGLSPAVLLEVICMLPTPSPVMSTSAALASNLAT